MPRVRTNLGKLGRIQRLAGSLNANSAELSHLEVSLAKLERLVGDAHEALNLQGALAAEKQEASRRFQTALSGGERLSSMLRLAVKEHYGIRSEKLTEFGLQPFRGRPRKQAEEPVTAAVAADPETDDLR